MVIAGFEKKSSNLSPPFFTCIIADPFRDARNISAPLLLFFPCKHYLFFFVSRSFASSISFVHRASNFLNVLWASLERHTNFSGLPVLSKRPLIFCLCKPRVLLAYVGPCLLYTPGLELYGYFVLFGESRHLSYKHVENIEFCLLKLIDTRNVNACSFDEYFSVSICNWLTPFPVLLPGHEFSWLMHSSHSPSVISNSRQHAFFVSYFFINPMANTLILLRQMHQHSM